MEFPVKISIYKRLRVWLNKKTSLFLLRRSNATEYLAIEAGVLSILMDGLMLSGSVAYLFNKSIYSMILSFGCLSFIIKKIFPHVIKLVSSINLVKVGR